MPAFTDFNFKLVVVEQLMYTDETLTPPFSIADLLKEQGLGDDPQNYAWDNGLDYKILPQAREYFEQLEISEEMLATVEEVCLDGGNQIYQECSPVWDGEDDLFDIASLADLHLVPNLKTVSFSEALSEELQAQLRAAGIECD